MVWMNPSDVAATLMLRLRVEILWNVGRGVWARTPEQRFGLARDAYRPIAWRPRDDGLITVIKRKTDLRLSVNAGLSST